ncbi:MAG: dehydratase [Betaproteobacteria bacterium RIFCSPLOWO2_02_FULL_64_12]|nr:MAG: dehydratase [Betaproteobacteria bacterium RIFCSPLOWO2_02_FULL_64_12]
MAGGKKYYFEDFPPGMRVELAGPTLTREEIIEFAKRYDPQPFHVDEEEAKHSIFGGLVASGWHTVSLCMRLMCDAYLLDAASLGSPEVKRVQWKHPVRPGDTLKLRMEVLAAQPSRSKPDRGVVLHRWEVFNQRGECVMTLDGYGMFLRREAGS